MQTETAANSFWSAVAKRHGDANAARQNRNRNVPPCSNPHGRRLTPVGRVFVEHRLLPERPAPRGGGKRTGQEHQPRHARHGHPCAGVGRGEAARVWADIGEGTANTGGVSVVVMASTSPPSNTQVSSRGVLLSSAVAFAHGHTTARNRTIASATAGVTSILLRATRCFSSSFWCCFTPAVVCVATTMFHPVA
jgi:hypothetical protein